jgi:3-deoxy-manno-octulosonate cytidylyltransferase (CMP-KDO synthetase)
MQKSAIIIPARLQSTRLQNKVLLDICGKTLIERVYERVQLAKLSKRVVVATDSEEVKREVESFGGEAVMTLSTHQSGTDRVAEVVEQLDDVDFVINLQGDEPLIDPNLIDSLQELFLQDEKREIEFATARHLISEEDAQNPNIVKVIVDKNSDAIYFSRSPIPFHRDGDEEIRYFQHIGIYGYRKEFLQKYANMEQTTLEKAEKLEQLRAVENGYKIRVIETEYRSIGVDTAEDLENVRDIFRKNGSK